MNIGFLLGFRINSCFEDHTYKSVNGSQENRREIPNLATCFNRPWPSHMMIPNLLLGIVAEPVVQWKVCAQWVVHALTGLAFSKRPVLLGNSP